MEELQQSSVLFGNQERGAAAADGLSTSGWKYNPFYVCFFNRLLLEHQFVNEVERLYCESPYLHQTNICQLLRSGDWMKVGGARTESLLHEERGGARPE